MDTYRMNTGEGMFTVQLGRGGVYVFTNRKLAPNGKSNVVMVQFDTDEALTLHHVETINRSTQLPKVVKPKNARQQELVDFLVDDARRAVNQAKQERLGIERAFVN